MILEKRPGGELLGSSSGLSTIRTDTRTELTQNRSRSQKHLRSTIEKTTFFRYLLQAIGVFAVSMAIADGVLTPAQSVLGAVQGLNEIDGTITKSSIIGVTCAILILLFLLQPFGINRISVVFSPIVMIWLTLNSTFGMYNLAKYVSCSDVEFAIC